MSLDWSELFGLSVSPVELIIRGSAMYLFLFAVFRMLVHRRVGAVGMLEHAHRLGELPLPFPAENILRRNLRHEFVTEDELRSKLREHGIEDLRQIARAYMESDGQVSVIKKPSFR